jgi:hypothetical protein
VSVSAVGSLSVQPRARSRQNKQAASRELADENGKVLEMEAPELKPSPARSPRRFVALAPAYLQKGPTENADSSNKSRMWTISLK